jgi:hypothetical protein
VVERVDADGFVHATVVSPVGLSVAFETVETEYGFWDGPFGTCRPDHLSPVVLRAG